MRCPGWTLHEMLISLAVLGVVVALAASVGVTELRFFRGVGEVVELRTQVGQASAIAASFMTSLSPSAGDILVAQDSAIEMQISVGAAVTCASAPGFITVPAAAALTGNTLSAFTDPPVAGDRIAALLADSLGATWLTFHAASSPNTGGRCALFGGPGLSLAVQEQVAVPLGTVLQLFRPLRLSLYRASDNRWYLGAKDWNAATQRFNTIQPVAGPLEPYSSNPGKTGLLFAYRDQAGDELAAPVETNRIASVTIIARGETRRLVRASGFSPGADGSYMDSTTAVVAFRNRH